MDALISTLQRIIEELEARADVFRAARTIFVRFAPVAALISAALIAADHEFDLVSFDVTALAYYSAIAFCLLLVAVLWARYAISRSRLVAAFTKHSPRLGEIRYFLGNAKLEPGVKLIVGQEFQRLDRLFLEFEKLIKRTQKS